MARTARTLQPSLVFPPEVAPMRPRVADANSQPVEAPARMLQEVLAQRFEPARMVGRWPVWATLAFCGGVSLLLWVALLAVGWAALA